ncbi:MAG: serine/threonine protein kinase [Phycisphaeraceae bacterium]|nr:serine/threonine protein kinase [Phycisphaeraceae bacterium]
MSSVRDLFGYRVLARIGQGAASVLYAVQDPKSKQVYALKHVVKRGEKDDRFLEQCESEASIGAKLNHPNIRRIEKILRTRKLFRVVEVGLLMELVDAATLDRRLPTTAAEAARIFAQVAHGLAHMHARGFVHADMKPINVMLSEDGSVKVIDLGQACEVGTIKKRIQGTPGYMAPEQAHREAITPQTDIYNFGATMYWVLVGEVIPTALPPKDENNSIYSGAVDPNQVKMPVPPAQRDPESIRRGNGFVVPQSLSDLVMECIQIVPSDRVASMDLVADRLDAIAAELSQPQRAAAK